MTNANKPRNEILVEIDTLRSRLKVAEEELRAIDSGKEAGAITDHKRAEAALSDNEDLYRAVGESIDYGVWVCTPDGRNIYASDSFLRLVGLTQEQCSGFGWCDALHQDDADRAISAWKECIRTEGVMDFEHRFRGVDGQYGQRWKRSCGNLQIQG